MLIECVMNFNLILGMSSGIYEYAYTMIIMWLVFQWDEILVLYLKCMYLSRIYINGNFMYIIF